MNKLAEYTKNYVIGSGYKLQFIADRLGVTRQYLNILFNKKSFNENDANRILGCIEKKIDIKYDIIDFDFVRHIDNIDNIDNKKED